MNKPFLEVQDFTDSFFEGIKALRDQETLVGIPFNKSDRKRAEKGVEEPANNAAILFINEFGTYDSGGNVPPRPAMKIGIGLVQERIAEEFKAAAKSILSLVRNSSGGSAQTLSAYYERVGIIASQSVKNVITNQTGISGPSSSTLKMRESAGFLGTKSLLVTGQLRNAITYVVRGK